VLLHILAAITANPYTRQITDTGTQNRDGVSSVKPAIPVTAEARGMSLYNPSGIQIVPNISASFLVTITPLGVIWLVDFFWIGIVCAVPAGLIHPHPVRIGCGERFPSFFDTDRQDDFSKYRAENFCFPEHLFHPGQKIINLAAIITAQYLADGG
jgi:hypothetical protein